MCNTPTTPTATAVPDELFSLDLDALAELLRELGSEQHCAPETLRLDDLQGEWLNEQLADLIERSQSGEHPVISAPLIASRRVYAIVYAFEDGVIYGLRHDWLFFEHGAQIDAGWDEPAAFIPMREDKTDLDLTDFAGILSLVVERANALLPVLRAAMGVPAVRNTN